MSKSSDDALAAISQPQDVTFTIPLKLAVSMIALAESNDMNSTYRESIVSMKSQIASQLSGRRS